MEEKKVFYIEKDNQQIKANIITNFELYGDNYCIYTVPFNGNNNVYCAKIIDNKLIKIENKEERELTNKIVTTLLNQN